MITFIDSTLADARTNGCDTVQIKYDGIFAQFSCRDGNFDAVTRDGRRDNYPGINPDVSCVLIGSYRKPLHLFYVFDCWSVEEPPDNIIDLRREPYRTRYVAAKVQVRLLNGPFKLVQSHPITAAEALWRTLPEVPHAKGLVFRNSKDPVGTLVRVKRWYAEVPGELV